MKKTFLYFLLTCLLCLNPLSNPAAGEVSIAAAANLASVINELVKKFEHSSHHTTKITLSSTGKLYSQIRRGSTFDVFLAADQRSPHLLEIDGLANGRFTYAIGKLALWHRAENHLVNESELKQGDFSKLALANPKEAPYGAAAVTVMERLKMDKRNIEKWVIGEDIIQTQQLITSGAAELGFLPLSQLLLDNKGSYWEIPQALYDPILQDAVLLKRGQTNPAAIEFMTYLQSPAARMILDIYGYATE